MSGKFDFTIKTEKDLADAVREFIYEYGVSMPAGRIFSAFAEAPA